MRLITRIFKLIKGLTKIRLLLISLFTLILISEIVYLYLVIQNEIWELSGLLILNSIISLVFFVSILLNLRGYIKLSINLILAMLLFIPPCITLLIADVGLLTGLSIMAVTSLIANQVFDNKKTTKVFIISIFSALLALLFDIMSLGRQVFIPEIQVFLPTMIAILVIIFSFFVVQESIQRKQAEANLLKRQQELERLNERLQQELTLAYRVQQGFLPPSHPQWQNLDIVCYSQPAQEVGGDFYTYYQFNHKHFAVAVGDVSGKGVSAALLMAICLTQFDVAMKEALSPINLLEYLDDFLLRYTIANHQNCALCYAEIQGQTLHVVNAGGIAPYIRRANGQVEELDVGGFPLGVGLVTGTHYQSFSTPLSSGDMVILVSDGVIEANSNTRHLFGFDRFKESIKAGPTNNVEAMLSYLNNELNSFMGTADLHDDLTITVVQIK